MKIKLRREKFGNYQFCNMEELVALWCGYHYPTEILVVLFDAKNAFDSIPYLNILKRDNFPVYLMGMKSEFVFITFDNVEKARDFVFGFEEKGNIRWSIYNHGKLHTKAKEIKQ